MMKTAETITTSTQRQPQTGQPFFQKEGGESAFFSETQTEVQGKPFFDAVEEPVDSGIDTLISEGSDHSPDGGVPVKEATSNVVETSTVQTKCAECEEEEGIEKKEEQSEELVEQESEIQENPIFESEGETQEEPIQTKLSTEGLTIGAPDDAYEKEADAMADQVVQKLAEPEAVTKDEDEEVSSEVEPEVQEKPIFESEANEEAVQTKPMAEAINSIDAATEPSIASVAPTTTLQAKCAECEEEEQEEMVQEQPEVQKKPIFDSAEDPPEEESPDLQRFTTKEMEKTDYPILFKRVPQVQLSGGSGSESSIRERIVKEAQKMVGKIEAKKDDGSGRRVGADHLLKIFHLAANDAWSDEVIENVRHQQGEKTGFPHWCGIFSVYAVKKAGIDLGYWEPGRGVSRHGTLEPTDDPKPGDIGYFHEKSHHCIIKAVNGDTIESIDGNSGNFSEVLERTRSRSAFKQGGFFTPFTGSEKIIQKKEEAGATSESKPSLKDQLGSTTDKGTPLDDNIKGQMESGFGADFNDVNIHTDSRAVKMNKGLNAQAFTHGSDIYFNQGKYNPETSSGKHLLAHELTHTVQQGASVNKKIIQKNGNGPPTSSSTTGNLETGQVTNANETITYASIPVTAFKLTGGREHLYSQHNLKRHKEFSGSRRRERINQRNIWRNELDNTLIESKLTEKHNQANGVQTSLSGSHTIYAFKVGEADNYYLTGTIQNVVREATIPKWSNRGRFIERGNEYFQVDHIVEMQISGFPQDTSVNAIDNLELLRGRENLISGGIIRNSVESKITQTLNNEESAATLEEKISGLSEKSNEEKILAVKNNYHLVFNDYSSGRGPRRVRRDKFWIRSEIEAGDHIEHLTPVNMSELGSEGSILVFPRKYHPIGKHFRWDGSNQTPTTGERNWFAPYRITSKTFFNDPDSDILGHLVLEFPSDNPLIRATGGTVELKKLPGAQFAGYVDNIFDDTGSASGGRRSIISAANIAAKQFSPVRLEEIVFLDGRLLIIGKVLPTLGFIENAELDLIIEGSEITISKTFTNETLSLPSPFELTQTSLTLFASSTRGFGIEGRVDFIISNVGEGHIGAAASTSGGFELEGAFNFDSELFDPAEVNVEYKDNTWTIGGQIGIPEGKIRGVKNATITASYSQNNFAANGEAELNIPGIERGTMSVHYGEDGFALSGNFDLSSDVPGITGGRVEARVSKESGAEEYNVFVSGTAQPDIPGITSSLTVTYDNGALTIEGNAAYSSGMLSGTVEVGATNRVIGDDGQPTGEPDDTMRVYGGGTLTLQLTPWLAATAGVKLLPTGEIEVTARLAVDSYDVFDRREFNRNLFTVPTIEIPLFAIPLGPRSLGLVAQIGGGLDFSAGFGPGQLRNLSAEITYNPEREDETTVTGHGEFAIPADAGLTLRGDLGLGLSVAIASLSGGIEIAGTLGLEGEAVASVDLNWGPQTGLVLDAEGRVTVNPKFTFDINAFARASLGIGFLSISETWRHNLVSFEWGPDIQFGIVFPVHYAEDEPFDISFDDLEVIYPELDVVDMAVDLARDIKDDLFS